MVIEGETNISDVKCLSDLSLFFRHAKSFFQMELTKCSEIRATETDVSFEEIPDNILRFPVFGSVSEVCESLS